MKRFLLFTAVAFSAAGTALSQQVTFTTSGTWTVPAGATSATIEVVGAGGNGRPNGRGGGGGGGYASGTFTVVPGATHTITVGTGGSTTATSVSGLATPIQATPGATAPNVTTGLGGAGGVGSGGTINRTGGAGGTGTYTYFGGGGGGAAGPTANGGAGGSTPAWTGSNCLTPGGAAGTSGGAPGGAGGKGAGFIDNSCNTADPAAPGAAYGGGGGGGNGNSSPAANGADGFVRITWCTAISAPTGAANQSFCSQNNPTVADLTATGTGVQWYTTATGGTALAATTPLANGQYYASQMVGSCESPRLAVTVIITTTPAAPTGAATQAFCSYNAPTVANLAATGTGIQWYTAVVGGAPLPVTTPLVSGQQYFASQMVSGCESATRLAVTANITTLNVATTPPVGNTVSVATTPGATYQWINCANNQPIANATTASYTATANGSYAVIVMQDGCRDTSACVAVTAAGIGDVTLSGAITLYPNPVSEAITVRVPSMITGTDYSITDASGRKVKEGKLMAETTEISVRDLARGVYHFSAAGYAGQSFKVVKQ